ncbi:hypothetical protein [Paenibacillus xylanexedens]|uniref:hypothetical protein n=1 Tax=Paenibacillus xylanexedens TaxID=528191 RepID=UPI0011A7EE67|nr:hypothetical protein [Paenibacillus xylanexedens]
MGKSYDCAAAMRKLRAYRKENGLCIFCGSPDLDTGQMCAYHAAKLRKYEDSPKRESGHRYPLERRSKLDPDILVGKDWRKR